MDSKGVRYSSVRTVRIRGCIDSGVCGRCLYPNYLSLRKNRHNNVSGQIKSITDQNVKCPASRTLHRRIAVALRSFTAVRSSNEKFAMLLLDGLNCRASLVGPASLPLEDVCCQSRRNRKNKSAGRDLASCLNGRKSCRLRPLRTRLVRSRRSLTLVERSVMAPTRPSVLAKAVKLYFFGSAIGGETNCQSHSQHNRTK